MLCCEEFAFYAESIGWFIELIPALKLPLGVKPIGKLPDCPIMLCMF
jgi:hypothetical protein